MYNDPRVEIEDDEDKTIRTLIGQAIMAALSAAPFHRDPDKDQDIKLFDFGGGGVLDDIVTEQTPAFRYEEGDETDDDKMYGVVDKNMRVYIHFKVVKGEGVDPVPMINYYFGRITRVLVTPENFADLVFDVSEAGNSIQYQGQSDPEPGGTVMFDVQYRHGRGNLFSEEPA